MARCSRTSVSVLGLSYEAPGLDVTKVRALPPTLRACMVKPASDPPARELRDAGERVRRLAHAADQASDASCSVRAMRAATASPAASGSVTTPKPWRRCSAFRCSARQPVRRGVHPGRRHARCRRQPAAHRREPARVAPRWRQRTAFLLLPTLLQGRALALIRAGMAAPGRIELGEKQLALLRTLRNPALVAFEQAA